MKFPVTFSLLVFCVLTLTSGHRKVKSPRNFIGVLKQNFDSLCAKISTLEGEVREQRNQMTTLEEEVREQRDQMSTLDDKVREQEEELRELKMQIEQRG